MIAVNPPQPWPNWYWATYQRLPDELQRELTSKGWMYGVDWAQVEEFAAKATEQELQDAIRRFRNQPRIANYYEVRRSERFPA